MTAVAATGHSVKPPRLLLDTNVYLHLAGQQLASYRERFRTLAAETPQPLFWACQITFEELVGRIRPEDHAGFVEHRRALWWMEKLCGEPGMAEDLTWIQRRGVFLNAVPPDRGNGTAMIAVRRDILRAKTFGHLSAALQSAIATRRSQNGRSVQNWVALRTELGKDIRAARIRSGQPGVSVEDATADAILEISRKHAIEDVPMWGDFRTTEDQRRAQRELIFFETSYFLKERNSKPYNYDKWRSDYGDYWLCAYCSGDYTVVTSDRRLLNSIEGAGCDNPRLVDVNGGLALAESWLRGAR